jgi:hypothetical protein
VRPSGQAASAARPCALPGSDTLAETLAWVTVLPCCGNQAKRNSRSEQQRPLRRAGEHGDWLTAYWSERANNDPDSGCCRRFGGPGGYAPGAQLIACRRRALKEPAGRTTAPKLTLRSAHRSAQHWIKKWFTIPADSIGGNTRQLPVPLGLP